jgi:predicted permease
MRFFRKLLHRRRLHADLEAELAFHRELAAANANPVGLGNETRIVEETLDLWRFTTIENLWRDVVYGARGLLRSPALVVTAVVSLGLGLGVNTTIFSLGVEFLLSEPSVRDASTVVNVREGGNSHLDPDIFDIIRRSGVFEDMAGDFNETFVNWNDGHETHRLFASATTKNYFSLLGIPTELGRGIRPDDPDTVVVLGHRFWRTRLNGDPGVIGHAISIEGRPYTVIGVLPRQHRTLLGFGFTPDVYLPVFAKDTRLQAYARLKPGMTIGEASMRVQPLAEEISRMEPGRWPARTPMHVEAVAGFEHMRAARVVATAGLFFLLLLGAVGLVLLVACINVAGLLLARATTRRRELAIRLSLGASRGRLLQQQIVESLLLAVAGGVTGFALAQVTASILGGLQLPLPVPISLHVQPDWRIVSYAAAMTIVAALAAGVLPAWRAVTESIAPELGRSTRVRLRRALVIAQVAGSAVVVATAFLFVRNLMASNSIAPGFDVGRTVHAEVNLPIAAYQTPAAIDAYFGRALAGLTALPGVEAAAFAHTMPFIDSNTFGMDLIVKETGRKIHVQFHGNAVTPDYFRAMGIPLLQGRTFGAADRGQIPVAVVNRSFAARYFGQQSPVGAEVLWDVGPPGKPNMVSRTIVGVVEDTKNMSLGEEDEPQLYEPFAQSPNDRRRLQCVVRVATPPALAVAPVRQALRAAEPDAGSDVATMESSIGFALVPSQVGAVLVGSIGALGLVLAAVGLYGTLAYSVARRAPEIALRVAIGATRQDISRFVMADAAWLVGIGSAIGLLAAFVVMQPLAVFLVPGLTPTDPAVFAGVAVTFAVTTVIAAWGPMHRALKVDPIVTLRHD